MIAFVLVGIAVVIGLALWFLPRTRSTTVTVGTSNGFISMSTSESKTTPVPRDRYERVLARYVKGDLFDNIWVAHKPGDEGFTLTRDGADSEMAVTFLPLMEAARIRTFRKIMKAPGHVGTEHRWNVGEGPDMESLTISYRVPTDATLPPFVDRVLTAVDGPSSGSVYVLPWLTDPDVGKTFSVQRERDYLAEIP